VALEDEEAFVEVVVHVGGHFVARRGGAVQHREPLGGLRAADEDLASRGR